MDTNTTNQSSPILVQTPGAGQKCKIRRGSAQMLKAARRVRVSGGGVSLKKFASVLAEAGDKVAATWLRHKRIKPTKKPPVRRAKKPSEAASKISGRLKTTRMPIRISPTKVTI